MNVSAAMWDAVNKFTHDAGFKLIFGLDALTRRNGKWDPSNAKTLLHYSAQKSYIIAGFELGNGRTNSFIS